MPARNAAALIIGNEILSGKVEEANVGVLARMLRGLGISFDRIVTVPDDIDIIAREIRALSDAHSWVFTSGGVGPTHDDVTVEAAAKAFGRKVISEPSMEAMLRAHYKDKCTPGHLRMALIPEGAHLETTAEVRWPTIRIENTWLLPGIPEVFRMKLPVVVARIATPEDRPFVSRAVFTHMDEGDLKPLLDAVVAAYPDVEVGSYPTWSDPSYKTKLTFDGREAARVDEAKDAFVKTLPAGEPQRQS